MPNFQMRLREKLDVVRDIALHSLLIVCGFLVLAMAFLATYGVARRYIFSKPEPYSYELMRIFLLLSGVFAAASVEYFNRHVRNDLLSTRFPNGIEIAVVKMIGPALALVFCLMLTWKSLGDALYASRIGQTSDSPWAIPLAPVKLMIPIGYFLLCLVLFWKFLLGIGALHKHIKERK